MTILVVRVVSDGIIFGADRNITNTTTISCPEKTKRTVTGQSRRPKVLRWPNNKALIGYAGAATINNLSTDEWLYNFIGKNFEFSSFEYLANKLKDEVEKQRITDEGGSEAEDLLIHLAGFETRASCTVPVIWFIRNIYKMTDGQYNDIRKEYLCTEEFLSSLQYKKIPFDQVKSTILRNEQVLNPLGFQQGFSLNTFNVYEASLKGVSKYLSEMHPDWPAPQSLYDWEKHIKMSILTYGAFFETYHEPWEQFVGGGADIVSIKWPDVL